MDEIEISSIDYTDHELKCRICFEPFNDGDQRIEILSWLHPKSIDAKFQDVTQILVEFYNLKISNEFSRALCVACNYQLNNHWEYRKKIVEAQSKLYKFAASDSFIDVKVKLEIEEDEKNQFVNCVLEMKHEVYSENESDLCQNVSEASEEIPRISKVSRKRGRPKKVAQIFRYRCAECDFNCDTKHSLRFHLRHAHFGRKARDGQNLNFETQAYQCSVCIRVFDTFDKLHRHKLNLHKKVVCIHCNKAVKGMSSLKAHMIEYHKSNLTCPFADCGKVCVNNQKLHSHIKSHNGGEKEICPLCGQTLSTRSGLDTHIERIHLKVLRFSCDLCDYLGYYKHHISQHVRTHLDKSEREKFCCDEPGCCFQSINKKSLQDHKRYRHLGQQKFFTCHCGKIFKHSSSYNTHVKIAHGNAKKHECKLCPKSFFVMWRLRNHIKTKHLKKKDIPCTMCEKMFSTTRHLKNHMVYHAPPQHICDYPDCRSGFYAAGKLIAHYKFHNNQKDHKCHLCDKTYFHKTNLKKHFRQSHGII